MCTHFDSLGIEQLYALYTETKEDVASSDVLSFTFFSLYSFELMTRIHVADKKPLAVTIWCGKM